jgi:hypothetical protein
MLFWRILLAQFFEYLFHLIFIGERYRLLRTLKLTTLTIYFTIIRVSYVTLLFILIVGKDIMLTGAYAYLATFAF